MKKTLAIVLSLVLCIGLLAACGEGESTPSANPTENTETSAQPSETGEALSGNVAANGSTSMEAVIQGLQIGRAHV